MTEAHDQAMHQAARFPRVLRDLVQGLRYREGWRFALADIDRGQGSAIDGDKPYAPSHGFGQDPYIVRELGTEKDQRTSFRNELNE